MFSSTFFIQIKNGDKEIDSIVDVDVDVDEIQKMSLNNVY
jgi:hypothetical protein